MPVKSTDQLVCCLGEFVIRGIEAEPACAGEVNLRPSMRGTVLAFAHLYVAGDKSRTEIERLANFSERVATVALQGLA